jgi:hypothetical protein
LPFYSPRLLVRLLTHPRRKINAEIEIAGSAASLPVATAFNFCFSKAATW